MFLRQRRISGIYKVVSAQVPAVRTSYLVNLKYLLVATSSVYTSLEKGFRPFFSKANVIFFLVAPKIELM